MFSLATWFMSEMQELLWVILILTVSQRSSAAENKEACKIYDDDGKFYMWEKVGTSYKLSYLDDKDPGPSFYNS